MKKPNIKLLSYKNKLFFMYDTNKNDVKNITYETYNLLRDILAEKDYSNRINSEIGHLLEEDYLLPDYPQHIEQPLSEYLPLYLENRISGIVLQVTQNCNLKCKYCVYAINGIYNRKHSSKRMELETAQKSVDYLKVHSKDLSNVRISFYGGEPMLNISLIKTIVSYAEKSMPYKKISFAMTTNLTLLSSEDIDFFREHNFFLTISLDGPREVNDKNRFFATNGGSTYNTVIDNLHRLAADADYYNNNLQINAVVDKSVDREFISAFFQNNNLFNNVKIGYSIVNDSNLRIQYYSSPQYIKREKINVFKDTISRAVYGTDNEDSFNDIYEKLSKKAVRFSRQKYIHHNGPCIPGVRKLFVDVNGNFFPCEKANDLSQNLQIGDVENGINIEKVKKIYNLGKINEEECKSCWAIRLCSCCAVNIDDGKCISKELKRNWCDAKTKQLEKRLIQVGLIRLISTETK